MAEQLTDADVVEALKALAIEDPTNGEPADLVRYLNDNPESGVGDILARHVSEMLFDPLSGEDVDCVLCRAARERGLFDEYDQEED